jgi:hypothetical protein
MIMSIMSTRVWVAKAQMKHGDTYCYDKSVYNGMHNNIEFECKIHGMVSQTAMKHLIGQCCPKCKPARIIKPPIIRTRTNPIDYSNKQIGMLSVIKLHIMPKKDKNIWWECVCKCGTQVLRTSSQLSNNLKSNLKCSCGCHRKKPPYYPLYTILLRASNKKKYKKVLNFDEFLEFTKITKCFYCHNDIIWEKSNGAYNLDRIDNSIGYIKTNLVVACKRCNFMKSKYNTNEFITHCHRIANNHKI